MTPLRAVVRLLDLSGSILLVGAFTFLLVVARPAFASGGPAVQGAFERFEHRLLRIAAAALLAAAASACLGLWLQAAVASGRPLVDALAPGLLLRLVTGTRYGHVWSVRVLLDLLLGGLLVAVLRRRAGPGRPAVPAVGLALAAPMLAASAWAGHAGAADGRGLAFQLAADVVHLLAAGVWLGGLPLLGLLLASTRRAADPAAMAIAARATRRFSALALVAVGLLVQSGLAVAWVQVGSIPALVGTLYGRLLLLKIGLLLIAMGLAALNLFREKPGLTGAAAEGRPAAAAEAVSRLERNVLLEAALGLLILAVVGWLGITTPGRHTDPVWPFGFRLSRQALEEALRLPGVGSRMVAGANIILWSLFAFGVAAVIRRHRALAAAAGAAGLALGAFVLWPTRVLVLIDAYPTTYLRPAVPYQAVSIANGLRLYRTHCAVCHGASGRGDGPAAAGLDPRPANLTAGHTAEHTAGDLFWWITHGIAGSAMPGFGDRLSEEERWDLINVVRLLGAAESARSLGPATDREPRIVAPDFAYSTASGEGGVLSGRRGEKVVLLVFFTLPDSRERLAALGAAYPAIRRLGGEVLAVPLEADRADGSPAWEPPAAFPVVVNGAEEAAATYRLLSRGLRAGAAPDHVEFLVDRAGYLRGRWIPGLEEGWAELRTLLREVERLASEPLRPAPDEHVH